MGSGKTYEVVASVILPAIKQGRDVVTNIHGLNEKAIYDHLQTPDKDCEFGKIHLVKNEQVESEFFFPEFVDEKFIVHDSTIVKPGNVVAIDEAWRPWGTTSKCVQHQMAFFREHRHCVDERGISCDLALVTQDITDIHKLLKNVVEMSLRFTKLKTLGMSKNYRVEVYEGAKLYRTKLITKSVRKYNPKIFPLYKSYSSATGSGVEKSLDSRQNMLKQGAFIFPLLAAAGLIAAGAWGLYSFFHPDVKQEEVTQSKTEKRVITGSQVNPTSMPLSEQSTTQPPQNTSTSIAGRIELDGDTWVILNTDSGLRIASPSMIYGRGISAITTDQNKAVPAYLNK